MTETADDNPVPAAGGSRRGSRRVAMQALYQWLLADTETTDLVRQFEGTGRLGDCDTEYFRILVQGVLADPDGLEAVIAPYLDRPPAQLDAVERAILLLGVFELRERLEVPYRVVLNEALELAKRFGAQDGHRFVNGVLDRAARELRPTEAGPRA